MKQIDNALVEASANGTVNKKALAIKLAAIAGATAAGIIGTVLVQRAAGANEETK